MSTITPINRHTELVVESDGTRAYKVYNKMSPHYYMDNTGSLNPIDITNIQTITKDTVGEIKLREKNIASVGFRTDGNKTKYLGIEVNQTGEYDTINGITRIGSVNGISPGTAAGEGSSTFFKINGT